MLTLRCPLKWKHTKIKTYVKLSANIGSRSFSIATLILITEKPIYPTTNKFDKDKAEHEQSDNNYYKKENFEYSTKTVNFVKDRKGSINV